MPADYPLRERLPSDVCIRCKHTRDLHEDKDAPGVRRPTVPIRESVATWCKATLYYGVPKAPHPCICFDPLYIRARNAAPMRTQADYPH